MATAANCAQMISDLSALGGASWYVASAVEAHERVHVNEWRASVNPEFSAAQTTIESLSTPSTCGMNSNNAETMIRSLPAYSNAINTATSNAISAFNAIPDPNANTDSAEFSVVNPIITAIRARANTNGWPVSCR